VTRHSSVTVRPATADDVAAINAVSRAVGQPLTDSGAEPAYVHHVLRTGTAVVAVERDGQVIGWAARRDADGVSMLTDLFVDPAHHGEGAGRRLLDALWSRPDGSPRATFSSQNLGALALYARAGLAPGWPLLYLTGPRHRYAGLDAVRVPAEASADVERRLTGADRLADHRYWTREPDSSGIVVRLHGEPIAAGAAGPDVLHHFVCVEHAAEALRAAVAVVAADQVTVRLPGPHPAVAELLAEDFRIVGFDVSMTTPGLTLSSDAAYSPAFA
jgi:GNAT superfamily N-acetyltransferase